LSAADDLHDAIFGFRPAKAGTAYERLAAVVLAGFGWQGVKHETRLRPEGRRAEQRLDVTATHPDGSIQRLLVECKDWNKNVGKGTLDALVGVRDQAGFDAAMAVTTKGFTSGAVDVAVDENVAMVVLREVQPNDRFVMGFRLELFPVGSQWSNVQFLVASDATDVDEGQRGGMSTEDHLFYPNGNPAETLGEVFEAQSGGLKEGVFEREVSFDDGRLAPIGTDEPPVPIVGIKWTETVSKSSPHVTESHETSKPCLVIEQLNDKGESERARLVVDRHLNAWRINEAGEVVSTERLA
jgi:hypothetical protein